MVGELGDRPIPGEVLRDVLEVARWTGSSKNSQRWELVVVRDRETVRRLAALAPAGDWSGAALAIVQVTTAAENADDLGRQAERIVLAAQAYGIGARVVPVSSPDVRRRVRELLGIPPRRIVPAVLALGYPVGGVEVDGPDYASEAKAETRFLRGLRSVRRYADRPIPVDVRREILKAAQVDDASGEAGAFSGFELVTVEDRNTLAALAALAPNGQHLARAALAIVRVGVPAEVREAVGRNVVALYAGRTEERLMLAAWAFGIGSCIIAVFPAENQRRARELLGTAADRGIGVIALGYPADERARFHSASPSDLLRPVPTGRKPLDRFVSWERYGHPAS